MVKGGRGGGAGGGMLQEGGKITVLLTGKWQGVFGKYGGCV